MARKTQVEAPKDNAFPANPKEGWWTMDVTTPGVTFGTVPIVRLELQPMTFSGFVSTQVASVQAMQEDEGADNRKYFFRLQLKRYLKGYDAAGTAYSPNDLDIINLHPRVALAIRRGSFQGGGDAPGEIIQKGNGIDAPIVMRLGTPIPIAGGAVIEELEFQALSWGKLEAVLFMDLESEKAAELIRSCAKPITTGTTAQLVGMPADAFEKIARADGLFVVDQVLPHFLRPDAA